MSSSGPQSSVQEGDVIGGKYRVERLLGEGGMGVVVAAHHLQLDTKVAIKFLLPHMLRNTDAVTRFAREARAAVKMTNEHVARVIDVGTLESGAPFMVMELLEGADLAARLAESGPLPIDQAIEFVLQACVGLAEAHSLGIIHRDLKPANLFVVRRPDGQLSVKVLDFGISKLLDGDGSQALTVTTAIMGSPLYMSPEQMQSTKLADSASDIWALGVILFELLTGKVPFDGQSATDVAIKVAMNPTPSVRALRPEVSEGVEAIIGRCLEKAPRQRYPNVGELALALGEYAPRRARSSVERVVGTIQSAGMSTRTLQMPPTPAPFVPAATMAPVQRTGVSPLAATTQASEKGPSRKAPVVVGVLVALVAVGGVGAFLVARHRAHPDAITAETTASAASPASQASSAPAPASPPTATLAPVADTAVAPVPAHETVDAGPARAASRPGLPVTAMTPRATSTAVATTPPPTSPPPGCDPPYTFDDQGGKHFKPECYLHK